MYNFFESGVAASRQDPLARLRCSLLTGCVSIAAFGSGVLGVWMFAGGLPGDALRVPLSGIALALAIECALIDIAMRRLRRRLGMQTIGGLAVELPLVYLSTVDPPPVDSSSGDPSSVGPSSVSPSRVDPAPRDPSFVDPLSVDPSSIDPARTDARAVGQPDVRPPSVDHPVVRALHVRA